MAVPTAAQTQLAARLEHVGGPISLADLSAVTGQHSNTLRDHLDALICLGLVERKLRPSSRRGRPAYVYALVSHHRAEAPASLLNALTGYLRATSENPGATAETLGRATAADEVTAAATSGTDTLVTAMERWGFAPSARGNRRWELRECPLLNIAMTDPDVVCGFHRGMTKGVAEAVGLDPAAVELVPFVEPEACLITLPDSPGSDEAGAAATAAAAEPQQPETGTHPRRTP